MIRVVAAAIGFAILVSILTGGNQTATTIAFVVALAAVCVPLLTGTSALRCPHCRKRVKLGASVCHHCSREVTRAHQ